MKRAKAKTKAKPRPAKVTPIPETHRTLTPSLCVDGGARAIEFYKKAFGAQVKFRLDMPDGKLGHAELKIGDSLFMLGDEYPDMGFRAPQPETGTPVHFYVYVTDVDAAFNRAVAAGATVKMPLTVMFWGDRVGKVGDPFGHQWSLASRVEIVSPKECLRRAQQMTPEPVTS
jgi:PhnB protein